MKLNLKKTFFYINIMISNIIASENIIEFENSMSSIIKDCECIEIQQIDNIYKLKLSEKMKSYIKDLNSEKLSMEYQNYIISSTLVNYCYELQIIRNNDFLSIDDIRDSLKSWPLDLIENEKGYYIVVNSDFAIRKLEDGLNIFNSNLNDMSKNQITIGVNPYT